MDFSSQTPPEPPTLDSSLDPSPAAHAAPLPVVALPTMLRLGCFQFGLGVMSVLTLGLLNRVMYSELGIPQAVAAGVIAMHQFVAPARVWFGQLSDSRPLLGLHRSGYMWLGAIAFSALAWVAVQTMWPLGHAIAAIGSWAWTGSTLGWAIALGAIFACYGLALSASSTPFTALLVDVSDDRNRSQLVGVAWSMLMVGIVVGAIVTSILLRGVGIDSDLATVQASVNQLFVIVPVAVVVIALLGTWGVERQYSRYHQRSHLGDREDQITLGRALRVLGASRQTGLFFSALIVLTLGLFMQEAVLENYGADIFGMPIAKTTLLNAFFGMGTLLGLNVAAFLIAPRWGKEVTAKAGCLAVAACFVGVIVIGFAPNPDPAWLQGAVGLFGLTSGVATMGAIGLMLDLTAAETAGTFVGAWGLAQAISRASATWFGGIVQTLGKSWFDSPLLPYVLVFGLEAGAMLLAVTLLNRVNVREFQRDSRTAIANVLELEMD